MTKAKHRTPEPIIHPLRQAEVATASGQPRAEGFRVNHERVERLWRRAGLKVPRRQPDRRRLWLNDGSCVRLRPEHRGHVWSYDFVKARTSDGRAFRLLTVIDEYTRECLAIDVARRTTARTTSPGSGIEGPPHARTMS